MRLTLVCMALAVAVSVGVSACSGCPQALLEGTLTEQDGDLVVVWGERDDFSRVDWPASGLRVSDEAGVLVLGDWLGAKAREGDFVRIGGGEAEPGLFVPCGDFAVEARP